MKHTGTWHDSISSDCLLSALSSTYASCSSVELAIPPDTLLVGSFIFAHWWKLLMMLMFHKFRCTSFESPSKWRPALQIWAAFQICSPTSSFWCSCEVKEEEVVSEDLYHSSIIMMNEHKHRSPHKWLVSHLPIGQSLHPVLLRLFSLSQIHFTVWTHVEHTISLQQTWIFMTESWISFEIFYISGDNGCNTRLGVCLT